MSISIGGLGSAFPDPVRPRSDEAARDASGGAHLPTHAGRLPVPERQSAGPTEEVGASTDRELWALLSGEERAYYLRNSITSAATYDVRRADGASPPAAAGTRVGGRLDVRA